MKKVIILFSLLLINCAAFAQRNFYKLNVGVGVGITRAYTDYNEVKGGQAKNIVLDYYLTPYSSIGVEVQDGTLKGHESVVKGFENEYLAVFGNAKLHLGEVLPFSYQDNSLQKLLKGVYFGAGIAVIKNKVGIYDNSATTHAHFVSSKDILIPLNVGIDFYLSDENASNRFSINLNAQTAFSLNDDIDGGMIAARSTKDRYHFFALGVRYSFGFKGYYPKGWPR